MDEKLKIIDWGDGHKVIIKLPDLSNLPKVTCPTDCYPVGEGGTGKVIKEESE
ncbi:MAG TPA: hypothetical protein VN174_03375 [Candidatus Methanoperedens sp.]|nr:hypothetical protein [Candidatus Methanoperedens sp.]